MDSIELERGHAAELSRLAREAGPSEACALLAGESVPGGFVVRELFVTPNVDPEPARRFTIAPEAMLAADRAARGRGLEIVGIFHSHPRGDAEPSAFDLERAWPYYAYLIARGDDLRAWRLAEGGSRFEAMEIRFRTGATSPETER